MHVCEKMVVFYLMKHRFGLSSQADMPMFVPFVLELVLETTFRLRDLNPAHLNIFCCLVQVSIDYKMGCRMLVSGLSCHVFCLLYQSQNLMEACCVLVTTCCHDSDLNLEHFLIKFLEMRDNRL